MRLTYLDILEQCFHDKFRGYNKQEVDTFLHLVADDFKSMAEDLKEKDRQIDLKSAEIKELEQRRDELTLQEPSTPPEVEEELRALRKELEEKDLLIQEMKKADASQPTGNNPLSQLTPEREVERKSKTNHQHRQAICRKTYSQRHKRIGLPANGNPKTTRTKTTTDG